MSYLCLPMTDWSDFVPRLLPRKTPGPGEFNWGRGVGPGVKAKPGELLALGTNHYLTRAGFPSPNLAQVLSCSRILSVRPTVVVIFVDMAAHPTEKDIPSSDIEVQRVESAGEMKPPVSDIKLDSSGLPLVPQPSDHKDDPLVRSSLRMCRTEGLLVLIHIIAELATLVQILCSAPALPSCVYRAM